MGDASVEFRAYLEAICGDPLERYVQTDAEILLRLHVQTALEKNPQQGNQTDKAKKAERLPVLEGICKYAADHVLLSGNPGSGKSTALKQLLRQEADRTLRGEVSTIPVLVELRAGKPIMELIREVFRRKRLRASEQQIDDWLFDGRLLLLIDGVNEIASDNLLRDLEDFRTSNSSTPMIFTTRDLGIRGDLGITKKLEMQPLSESQMREFVSAYLPAQGAELLRQLQDRLRELCETPLLLKMLCDVFAETQEIPQNKGELFRRFDRDYAKFKRIESISGELQRWKSELLQYLAFQMMSGQAGIRLQIDRTEAESILEAFLKDRVNAPADKAKLWLEDLIEHHLLQVAANRTQMEFHHQLFQEYFAAEYLLRQLDKLDDLMLKKLYLNSLDWTESLALMLGILDNEQRALRVVRLALEIDLKLGARLAGEVKPQFQQATVEQVICLDVPEWLRVELLGRTRSNVAVAYLKQILVDSTSDADTDVIRALAKMTCIPAIGILTSLLSHQDSVLRNEVTYALGQNGTKQAVNGLIQALADPVNFIRANSLKWLHKVDTELAIRALHQALNDSDYLVGKTASLLLNRQTKQLSYTQDMIKGSEKVMPHKTVSQLFQDVESQDWFIRGNAVKALGEIELTDQMSATFLNNLIEATDFVRNAAADALSKIANPQLLSQLWQFCRSDIREALDVISAIQERCRFYNYEVEQMALPADPKPNHATSVINIYGGKLGDVVAGDKNVKAKGDYIENQEK
jgi:HEAT repeat protein